MDLLEYQGKELFRRYGVPTAPAGQVADAVDDAHAAALAFDVPVMVKAQVRTGGRGKAGGVRYCADADAARTAAAEILGLDIRGHVVRTVLVEPASDIAEEYYLSVLYDRVGKGYKVICSAEGGVEIEEVNRTRPEAVAKVDVDPAAGLTTVLAEEIVAAGGLPDAVRADAAALLQRLYHTFVAADATLCEVNPLVRTTDGRVLALDAKVSIDDNALFRQPEAAALAAATAAGGNDLEARAQELGLAYVKLDGDVGILGNGAGLVMATLDVVSQAGGAPADFLDVGGGADADTMAHALSLVLDDPQVRVVLVNIFGGITRCNLIAEGILAALASLGAPPQKLVVRLDGTNAEEGRRLLAEADHPNVVAAAKMLPAAAEAVRLAAAGATAYR